MTPLYFEDFSIGDALISAERTLTAADIDTFATLSGDHNPLHIDPDFAASGPYGRPIAHGLLIQAIASGLLVNNGRLDGTAVGLRHVDCKLSAPVFVGDRIHVHSTVLKTKAIRRLNVGNIFVDFRVINQESTTVQKGTWQLLVKLRPDSEPAEES